MRSQSPNNKFFFGVCRTFTAAMRREPWPDFQFRKRVEVRLVIPLKLQVLGTTLDFGMCPLCKILAAQVTFWGKLPLLFSFTGFLLLWQFSCFALLLQARSACPTPFPGCPSCFQAGALHAMMLLQLISADFLAVVSQLYVWLGIPKPETLRPLIC